MARALALALLTLCACDQGEPCGAPTARELELAAARSACAFSAGASTEETLGVDRETAEAFPIRHLVVVMQENRSFDHYFARLSETHPDVEALPASYANPDASGNPVVPFHLDDYCLPADPPHQWDAMNAQWNEGAMDGFVRTAAVDGSDGRYALGYYDEGDLPFYYWLARTFAFGDRNFGSVLGGTWPNRSVLYTGSTNGLRDTGDFIVDDDVVETVFDQLDAAGISWGVFTNGAPRQDFLGWDGSHAGVEPFESFLAKLADETLPRVSFVDPIGIEDEHPPNDVRGGEQWTWRIVTAAIASPLWPRLAIVHTYDEGGGLFDHVSPPAACPPSADLPELDVLGHRVPLMVISPWAKPGYVSHATHDHASVLRLVQLLHDLPALTDRDANADALLDMFDFDCADPRLDPGPVTDPAGTPSSCG